MRFVETSHSRLMILLLVVAVLLALLLSPRGASGTPQDGTDAPGSACDPLGDKPTYRDAFFKVYTGAVGSRLDTLPSNASHCGVCHYDFDGGGTRNPYGLRLEQVLPNFPKNENGYKQAIQFIQNEDPDGDGFSSLTEITDLAGYINTPTFPGLTPANVGQAKHVSLTEIQTHLVPTKGDITPPVVTVIAPNGGESLIGNQQSSVQWTATDPSGIAKVDIYYSEDNGASWTPAALNLPNSGNHPWFPANRPTTTARIRVVATDNALNVGKDESNAAFTVASPPGGIVPSTLRDFDQPGTQPFEGGPTLANPNSCKSCHAGYNPAVEPGFNWDGSMMAHASLDLLFEANMVIANQDAPDSGDLCLRCHLPTGWLDGRSVPTNGSQMLPGDMTGVNCDLCHRMVDPVYKPGVSPIEDQAILAALSFPPATYGNGMYVVDPNATLRGPFTNAALGHAIIVSPFHRESAFCGTCHDVSNPAFEKDAGGKYVPNAFNQKATNFLATHLGPVERTYSEWLSSAYNSPTGIYAPKFGGNKQYVASCQDCHMRDVTGKGCNDPNAPTRTDLPLHDMTGGSTWLPSLLPTLYPGQVNAQAIAAGIDRARYMLQNAAELEAEQQGTQLKVTVTNDTGHKLPTGYPEGRRMWLNVKFFDAGNVLIAESGAYNAATGELGKDPEIKVYEVKPGLDEVTAPLVGVPPGPSFHFVLNNKTWKDNRIPPRGFTNAAFAAFGGAPAGYSYADGQHWDDTFYSLPAGATKAEVRLYYQSTSKEFIEFLRDENKTNSKGQELYDLWNSNGKCPPELMASETVALTPAIPGDLNGDGCVNQSDLGILLADYGCTAGPGLCPGDIDGDGKTGQSDLGILLAHYGEGC